jgi:hypothetical protein
MSTFYLPLCRLLCQLFVTFFRELRPLYRLLRWLLRRFSSRVDRELLPLDQLLRWLLPRFSLRDDADLSVALLVAFFDDATRFVGCCQSLISRFH